MRHLIIITGKNEALSEIVQKLLFANGYTWYAKSTRPKFTQEAVALHAANDGIISYSSELAYSQRRASAADVFIDLTAEPITKLLEALNSPSVKLNDRYTAVIHKDTEEVEVGCQKFTFSAVTELYKAIQ